MQIQLLIMGAGNSFDTSGFRDGLSGNQEAGIVDKNVNNDYRTPNIQCRSKIATALCGSVFAMDGTWRLKLFPCGTARDISSFQAGPAEFGRTAAGVGSDFASVRHNYIGRRRPEQAVAKPACERLFD